MKNVFAKYSTALIRIKLIEFAFCAVLATVLILTFPGVFYADVGLAKAALGGLIFSATFFLLGLYLVASVLVFFLAALLTSSAAWISSVSGAFMLAYSAFFALSASALFPASFWIAWLGMGVATFLITLKVVKNSR